MKKLLIIPFLSFIFQQSFAVPIPDHSTDDPDYMLCFETESVRVKSTNVFDSCRFLYNPVTSTDITSNVAVRNKYFQTPLGDIFDTNTNHSGLGGSSNHFIPCSDNQTFTQFGSIRPSPYDPVANGCSMALADCDSQNNFPESGFTQCIYMVGNGSDLDLTDMYNISPVMNASFQFDSFTEQDILGDSFYVYKDPALPAGDFTRVLPANSPYFNPTQCTDLDEDGVCFDQDPNDSDACFPDPQNENCSINDDNSANSLGWSLDEFCEYADCNRLGALLKQSPFGFDLENSVDIGQRDQFYYEDIILDPNGFFDGYKLHFTSACYSDSRFSTNEFFESSNNHYQTRNEFGDGEYTSPIFSFNDIDWEDGVLECPVNVATTYSYTDNYNVNFSFTAQSGSFTIQRDDLYSDLSVSDIQLINFGDLLPEPLATIYSFTIYPLLVGVVRITEFIYDRVIELVPVLRVLPDFFAPDPLSVVTRPTTFMGYEYPQGSTYNTGTEFYSPTITVQYRTHDTFQEILLRIFQAFFFMLVLAIVIYILYFKRTK